MYQVYVNGGEPMLAYMKRWWEERRIASGEAVHSYMKKYEMDKLRLEIKQALSDKRATEQMFQYAKGNDEVEWAILRQLAAEQRYRMLLNKARSMDVDWSRIRGELI